MNIEKELLNIKKELEDARREHAQDEGQLKGLLKQLKGLGCASEEEATELIKTLETEEEDLNDKAEKQIERIQSTWEELT